MAVNSALFVSGGKQSQHYIPGAYSRIDFVGGGAGTVAANNAVIMGDSRGGEPNKLLWFTSAAEAQDVLVSGPLLDAIRHAFSPGGGYVPQRIAAWRVNPGTKALRTHKSGSTNIFRVYAWDWGLHGNQVKTKLENGTVNGTKKYSVKYKTNPEVVVDNIRRESFVIQHIGTGTSATLTITPTGLTTTVDGNADLNVSFASFPTIEDLVNYINDQPDYTCARVTPNGSEKSIHLDSVTNQNIKQQYTATSTLQALIEAIRQMPWIGGVEVEAGLASRTLPDNDSDWVYLSGGIDGAYTATEWQTALSLLEAEDIQLIGTSSTQDFVHSMIKNHCEKMNSVAGKSERQFIVGGSLGETVDQAIARAKLLASDAGALCYPGFLHYDFQDMSKTKLWDPAYYACKEIGRQVALALNEPATNKDVDVLGWEKVLSTSDLEKLIQGGVWAGQQTKTGRFVNCRSITTYQGSELQRCEFSMMREALFAARDLRTAIERSFIGKAGTNGRLTEVDAIVNAKLAYYASDLQIFVGNPPYWGYKRTVLGDQIKIDYDANLTAPINFVFITSHFSVYASTNG